MQTMCLVMAKAENVVVSLDDVLRQAGYRGEFRIFHKVEIAQEYWEAHGRVDFFVIEDFILVKDDGVEFAKILHKAGQPVLVLSDFDVEGPPWFNRTFAYVDGGKSLLATVYRVYSGVSE